VSDARAELLALRNVGPKTVDWLIEVGVRSPAELDGLGTEEVYRRLKAARPAQVNLLAAFALEGALLDCHWNALPPGVKEHLRRELGGL
jgi:DNA transformation protein